MLLLAYTALKMHIQFGAILPLIALAGQYFLSLNTILSYSTNIDTLYFSILVAVSHSLY